MVENKREEISSVKTDEILQNHKKNIIQLTTGKLYGYMIIGAVFGGLLTFGGLKLYTAVNTNVLTQTTQLPEQLLTGLSNSYSVLKQTYLGELDEQKLIDGAISGFVSGVGDTYTTYLNETDMKSLTESTNAEFEGVGIEVQQVGEYIKIVTPIDNTPAYKAGIQSGDLIIKVDDVDMRNKNLSDMVKLVRGKKGTKVTLTIRRNQTDFAVELIRDTIPLVTVSAQMDVTDSTIGIIRISSFAKTTYDELVTHIKRLRESGAQSFVIDVRQNPGGLLGAVEKIVNMFVEEGVVMFQMEDTEVGKVQYKSSNKLGTFKVSEPVTILINKGSASASEIFASALQELNRAKVVGVTSFGKGTAQTIYNLTQTTGLKVTYSKWLTPNGNWVNEKGVVPDEVIELPSYSSLFLVNTVKVYSAKDNQSYSDEVFNIQKVMSALNYDVSLSGIYDDKFVAVIQSFQTKHGLTVNGVIDEVTANTINEQFSKLIKENDTQLQKARELLK